MYAQTLRNMKQPHLLLMRRGIPKHSIHLLERLAPRLRNTKPRKHKRDQRKRSKENIRAKPNTLKHIRRHKAYNKITHPGGRGSQRHCF
jgi:hypothetical protein